MKISILIATFIAVSFSSNSQKVMEDSTRYCSDVMKGLSYYWKLDSNANNGFRLYTHQMLLSAKVDKIDAYAIITKLGKPNRIRESNLYKEYIYYYFDMAKMPKDYDAPNACWYLTFKFKIGENYLSSVEQGDYDLFD